MSQPSGTVRTATTRRLVELIGDLDGFSTDPTDGLWWVTRPLNSPAKNRRIVVIGTGNTESIDPDGIGSGHGPTRDVWLIPCVLGITDDPNLSLEAAEQACEDAFNAIADLLAADGRLNRPNDPGPPGVFGVRPTTFETFSVWEAGKPPAAWALFDISASCQITRN